MTSLVYVPLSQVRIWKRRGWECINKGEEYDTNVNRKWAVLMHPPGWPEGDADQHDIPIKEAKKE